jgi:chorismate mutase
MSINAYQNQLEDIDNRILDLLERHKLISKMIKKIEKKTGQNVLTKENEEKNLNR